MKIYDEAHALVKAIRESSEYRHYKELLEEIENNSSLKIMIDDYHNRQMEMQKKQLLNSQISQEDEEKLKQLITVMSKDPKTLEYLNAEMKFAQIMSDVSKILSEL
ncbi:MAG: YlbF family regulator [Clostridiales bacterium]|nr:YlbF family regulator [Clostridiales bacterium]